VRARHSALHRLSSASQVSACSTGRGGSRFRAVRQRTRYSNEVDADPSSSPCGMSYEDYVDGCVGCCCLTLLGGSRAFSPRKPTPLLAACRMRQIGGEGVLPTPHRMPRARARSNAGKLSGLATTRVPGVDDGVVVMCGGVPPPRSTETAPPKGFDGGGTSGSRGACTTTGADRWRRHVLHRLVRMTMEVQGLCSV
jgi:hypothetical protein